MNDDDQNEAAMLVLGEEPMVGGGPVQPQLEHQTLLKPYPHSHCCQTMPGGTRP